MPPTKRILIALTFTAILFIILQSHLLRILRQFSPHQMHAFSEEVQQGERCAKGFGNVPLYESVNSNSRIPRIDAEEIDAKEFLQNFIERSRPVLLTRWARKKYARLLRLWLSDEYLATYVPNYEVNVEVSHKKGRFGYEEASWKRTMKPLRDFLRNYDKEEGKMYLSHDVFRSERANGVVPLPDFIYCLGRDPAANGLAAPIQYPDTLITQSQQELDDAPVAASFPFYTEFGIWFSAGGTNSLIHNDPHDNLLLQVDGYKRIYLFPPTEGKYIAEKRISMARTSTVNLQDPASWDAQFPGFKEHAWEHRIELVLTPGDILFIPAYWFHQVHSYCRNIAVNFWFDTFNMERLWRLRGINTLASDDIIMRMMRQNSQCSDVNENRRETSGAGSSRVLSWWELYDAQRRRGNKEEGLDERQERKID